MPRQGQIIPNWLHPHVQTYINDNSIFTDTTATAADNGVRLLCVFASPKGEDSVIKPFSDTKSFLEEYGTPNYTLYGQPQYNAYNALKSGNAKVYCMRVMPQSASYANTIISAKIKKDVNAEGKNIFKVKYVSEPYANLTDKDMLAVAIDSVEINPNEVDDEGYLTIPIMGIHAKGRGAYGNTLRFRVTSDVLTDAENNFKNYTFEVLDSESGLTKKEFFRGALYDAAIYLGESLFLDDVLEDSDNGSSKIASYISRANFEIIYNMYKEHVTDISGQPIGTPIPEVVPFEQFDFIFGRDKANVQNNGFIVEEGLAFDATDGISLVDGNDGEFAATATVEARQAAMNSEFIKAFNGQEPYDKTIRSKRRVPCELIMDAGYDLEVKLALAGLMLHRYDARGILDCGLIYNMSQFRVMKYNLQEIDDRIISKEMQHYKIRDPFNGKIIPVTITYWLAGNLPTHYKTFGEQIPFVGEGYAMIDDHIKNSIMPAIDADDLEVKEEIYTARFNYVECIAENTFVRGCQGTSQTVWSDLSEENNVAVMLDMKRQLEEFVSAKLYNFAEEEDRVRFSEDADRMFADYRNKKLRDFSVYFDMNPWEEERSILHCYLAITFKTLAKRGIIEIDINKRV